ncbi:MAG TPA: hypothetical protein VHU90_07800 [Galbitalea sp.]|nr:hypothetical protein [Galbitalea sp.]
MITGLSLSGPAATGIMRTIAYVFAVASVLLGALAAPTILPQLPSIAAWWNISAVVLVFGPPISMGAIARWVNPATLKLMAGVLAVGYPVMMLTLKPALTAGYLAPALQSPWILQLTALGTTAAAIAWPRWWTASYVLLLAGLLALVRIEAFPRPILDVASQDALNGLLYDAVFAALAVVAIRAGASLDGAATAARLEAEGAAAELAKGRERARAEALMHDSVLATLLTAGRTEVRAAAALATQAKKTLAQLEQFRKGHHDQTDLNAQEFVWMQQSITTEIAPEAQFSYELIDGVEIPGEVVQAFAEATGESLRNSCRHAIVAGRETTRAVHVRFSTTVVTVTILDDGPGFDLSLVAPTRLGLSIGILGRMRDLDGAAARVMSRPGGGTTISLEWTRT